MEASQHINCRHGWTTIRLDAEAEAASAAAAADMVDDDDDDDVNGCSTNAINPSLYSPISVQKLTTRRRLLQVVRDKTGLGVFSRRERSD